MISEDLTVCFFILVLQICDKNALKEIGWAYVIY